MLPMNAEQFQELLRDEFVKLGSAPGAKVVVKDRRGNLSTVVDVCVNYGTASSYGQGSVPHIQIVTKP